MITTIDQSRSHIYPHRGQTHLIRCDLCGTERGIKDPKDIPRGWLTRTIKNAHWVDGKHFDDERHACCEIHALETHVNEGKQNEAFYEAGDMRQSDLGQHYDRIKEQCGGISEKVRLRVIPILMELGWKKEGVYDPRNVVLAFPDEIDIEDLPPAWNTGLLDNTLDLQPDRFTMEPIDQWGWLQRAFS